jgi:Dyp-type peroxidase family
MPETLDLHDVQGLVARGYGNLPSARFLLLAIDDAAAARRWLGTAAVMRGDERPEQVAVNLALTSSGLERLGLDPAALAMFSNEFVAGMTTPHRRRILGDIGGDAPEAWDWGGSAAQPVHALLLLYARDAQRLDALEGEQSLTGLEVVHRLDTSDLDGFEPFGFRDGVSQPFVEGLAKEGPREATVRAGEFVLGYVNEYGLYTDRPLLDAAADPGGVLPRDPAGSGRADLGRNGSYLVFRQLRQDVGAFWQFVDRAAGGDATARLKLAAKMVGRWPSGAPLVLAPDADDPSLAEANDFAYHEHDRRGTRCPVGAHIRRTNPRDSLDPDPGTARSFEVNRRHRLLRRGREYGPPLTIDEALAGGDSRERGLHFICLNANIARQFEFVQHTWVNNPKFGELYDDSDPISAPSTPQGGTFTMPTDGVRERVTGVPRFVSVKGGGYFFLPGLAALRYLAGMGGEPGNSSSPVGS